MKTFKEFVNENIKEEIEKLRKKEESKYLSKEDQKKLTDKQKRARLFKRKDKGGMNDDDVPLVTKFTITPPEEKED